MSKFKSMGEYYSYSKTLSVIPTEDVVQLLEKNNIKLPYYVHRFILRETIYPRVFQNKLYDTYSDELKYRLRGYNDYSIYLLEKLIADYNLDFDAAKYKENLFNFLFLNLDLLKVKNSFFDELDKLKYKYTVDFEKIKYQDFIAEYGKVLYEPSGYLDGVSLKILKDVLVHSCTLGDLRGLGEKYEVKIPRRINKSKLLEILSARFRLNPEEAEAINSKSVLELEIYAKEKGFNISIDLKKSDMVEYLIFSLSMYHQDIAKDYYNYSIPLVSDLDSVKIDTIQFETNDQDIPVNEEEPAPVPVKEIEVQDAYVEEEESTTPEEEEVVPVEEEVIEPEEEVEEEPEEVEEEVVEEVVPEPEPVKVVEKVTPKEEKIVVKEVIKPVDPASVTVSKEEKELLDEKINQIIKRYKKRRRTRRVWFIILFVVLLAIIGFVGYSYLYYVANGDWPAWLPLP